jgi:hypothetical protein
LGGETVITAKPPPTAVRSGHGDREAGAKNTSVTGGQAELLQETVGNRAVATLVQRDKGTTGGAQEKRENKKAPLTLSMFRAAYPGIMNALDYEHTTVWFDIIAGWQVNREVDEKLQAMDQRARENAMSDPSYGAYRLTGQYQARAAAIEARRKFVDEGASRAPLDASKILKADITAPQPWNVDAEHRFRTWAVSYLTSAPFEAELSTRRELVSQWERTEHPELEGGFHANLLWGGQRIWNTGGYVGWDDLMHLPGVPEKYVADVTNGPHIQAIRAAIVELSAHIDQMMAEHENRSDKNAEHGIVRHVSEALGGPTLFELQILRLRVQANPDDTDAKANLAEKEAEAGSYPKMKGPDGIWFEPQTMLSAARRFFEGGQVELAAAAIAECQKTTAIATARFAGYERRVMKGAGVAVKWLERAKTAGKIASAFTGAGGIVRASITAAGYTFAQEGTQQVVAHWIDPANKIDLVGLTQQAAIDGLATLFGGLTQGAFVNALSARFGARMVASGISETTTKTVLSLAGATTASFYNVPAKLVLDKIIAGKAMPRSLSDICDMVVVEAVQSGAMDVAGGYIRKSGAKPETAPETAPGATSPKVAPLQEVVHALAGPEGAAYAQGVAHHPMLGTRGEVPAQPISAEAHRIAGRLEAVRQEWGNLSEQSRAERLIDAVYAEMAGTGLPKPTAIVRHSLGDFFNMHAWMIQFEAIPFKKQALTVDEFADVCEGARHEMEHALQDFRIARREALSGENATSLANRLQIPKDIAEMAIKANDGRVKAEPFEGAVAAETAKHYESVYGAGKAHRQKTIDELPKVIKALAEADLRVAEAKRSGRKDAVDLLNQAIKENNPTIRDYLNLPEEIPALEAGRQVSAAVKERIALNKQIADAKAELARVLSVVERMAKESAPNELKEQVMTASLRKATNELDRLLKKVKDLESGLAAVPHGGKP